MPFLTMNSTLDQIVEECGSRAERNGWRDDMPDRHEDPSGFTAWVSAKLMLTVGELSEALEELRNGHKVGEVYYGPDGKPEGFPVEVADGIIRLADLWHAVVQHEDEDGELVPLLMSEVVLEKLEYNDSRGKRHGGKAI